MVKPGITGWAQVCYGYANSLEEETEKMCYDLYYIKHCSLSLDLNILIRTVKVVFLGQQRIYLPEVEPVTRQPEEPTPDVSKEAA